MTFRVARRLISVDRVGVLPDSARGLRGRTEPITRRELEEIIRQESLAKASDYGRTTSRTVSIGGDLALHRDHHYALLSWARAAVLEKFAFGKTALVRFDLHPDLQDPWQPLPMELMRENVVARPDFLDQVGTYLEELDGYPDEIPEEAFTIPAFRMGMFNRFIHVVPGENECPDPILPKGIAIEARTMTLETFWREFLRDPLDHYLLDGDFDFFCFPGSAPQLKDFPYNRAGNLDSDLDMIAEIIRCRRPDFTTTAISPASQKKLAMIRYNTMTVRKNAMVLFRILQTLRLLDAGIVLYNEPRRSFRASAR